MKLLFIHGSVGGKEGWIYQTEYFKDSEAVALPGHPEGSLCSSIDEYVEWLRGYIHRQQYQDVVLVGRSMGSAIVQLYGLKYGEELKALVLVGAGARLRVLPSLLAGFKEMITDEAAWGKFLEDTYRFVAPEARRVVIEAAKKIGPAATLNDFLCCDKFDIMDKVHTIKLPTLVIFGSEDELTPVKYAHYLADKIETAREVIVEGATHVVFLEKPQVFNRAIEAFLDSLG